MAYANWVHPKREIPKDVRLYVHTQFRATAGWWLNLAVLKFRDHPDTYIKVFKDDLDQRFTFDPPVRPDYILFYIEATLQPAQYVWWRHWIATGRGDKHRRCPMRLFQLLVAYWRTKEADEEARVLKEERGKEEGARAASFQWQCRSWSHKTGMGRKINLPFLCQSW